MLEDKFIYSESNRWYTLRINNVEYEMAYVMTLRLTRFAKERQSLPLNEITELWYSGLGKSEHTMVKKKILE